ncbi:MAG TPA: catalase family peroxidase [Actinomycetota bacterium]
MADRLATELVGAFDALFGVHGGVRAAHAKGICCAATFTATPEAARLTRAPHMQGGPVRATVRFSHGSGDPDANDTSREPRGMATKFHLDGRKATDLIAVNQPVFVVRTPEEFLEFVRLRVPDPETGRFDLEALGAFVAARPESVRAAEILLRGMPPASFLQAEYFAIHAFRFVSADGGARFGRYRWEPELEPATLTKEERRERVPGYLQDDLLARLKEGPGRFTLRVQLATDEDDPTDPTTEWSADREQLVAGHLEITAPVGNQERDCERLLFDPMRLCDGIEPSDDPILHVRPHAYTVSSARRAKAKPRQGG